MYIYIWKYAFLKYKSRSSTRGDKHMKKGTIFLATFLLFFTSIQAQAESVVYETEFNFENFDSYDTSVHPSALGDYFGPLRLRSTLSFEALKREKFQIQQDSVTNCNDSANGNCQTSVFYATYVKIPVTQTKQIISQTGQVIAATNLKYIATLKGYSADPQPAKELSFVAFELVGDFDANRVLLKLGKFFIQDDSNNLLSRTWGSNRIAQPESSVKFKKLKYDIENSTVTSSGRVSVARGEVDDLVKVLSPVPLDRDNFDLAKDGLQLVLMSDFVPNRWKR